MPSLASLPIPAGKKLSKPQTNLLIQLDNFGVVAPAANETRTNPYTGKTHNLSPLACALYDFVTGARNNGWGTPISFNGHKVQVGQWDRTRYLFMDLWSDEYYDLLD